MKIRYKWVMEKLISFSLVAALCVSILVIPSSFAYAAEIGSVDRIEFIASDWGNYATISAYDKSGNVLWNYETPEYDPTELPRISEIGRKNENYFFIQDGTVIALNVKTGNKVWENGDFGGSGTGIVLGENAIYLCGQYGPDFYAVSYEGKTLTRIDQFDKNYYWASEIEILDEQAAVYLHGGTEDYNQPKAFYVDLNNYKYSTVNKDKHEDDLYSGILKMFHSNISSNWSERDGNGWDDIYDPDSVSYIFPQYLSNYSLAEIGYALIDLDDNGQSELLISSFDVADSGLFYDLYTKIDGEVVHLISGGERDRYYLTANNSINNEGSSSAFSSSTVNYYLDASIGKLKVKQAVIYDGYRDSKNPWFYATTEYYDADTYETNYDVMTHVSKEQAMSYIDNFPKNVSLELIPFDSYSSVDTPDTIEIKAYTAFPDSTIGTQQEVKIQFSKYINDKLATIEDYTLGISNPSVVEVTEEMESNGSKIITIKGLKQGDSDLTFTENSTGTSIMLPLTVADKCNYFRCSTFPIPDESSGSIYVAGFSCSANKDGSHSISFNAYNTSSAYGVVEVYNENGTLIKLVPLDPRTDSSGMEKVVNGFKWVWEDIKDLFDGDTPFYTKEKHAKRTPVTLDNIPENAEIIITSDGDESNFATLYMGVDTFVRTVCTASSIDLKFDAQAATVKELMRALVDSLIKSISHDETEKMIKQGLIKEASESISTAISFSSSADSISDIYETVSNMFQSMDVNAEDIMLNVLKGMGYNIADAAFTTAVPLYKIVNFVDQMLEMAWPLTDYQFNIGRGKMEIHVAKHGLQNYVSNNSVTITKQSNFSNNTVLDAYVVAETDELGKLTDVIAEEITNYEIYNITLREDGAEIQPDEEIEVRLPVPDGADGKKCVVYRIEENGEKTLLSSSYKDGYVTFRTPHLSYYLIGEATNYSTPTGIIIISILIVGGIAMTVVLLKCKKHSR